MKWTQRIQNAGRALTGRPPIRGFHEAGSTSGRLSGWVATSNDINTMLRTSGGEMVRRSRELVSSNGYALAARRSYVGNLIGTGIVPNCEAGNRDQQKLVQAEWDAWCKVSDADGQSRLYGLQSVVAGALFDAGEIFVRLRPRRARDGMRVPLQLQLLEAEFLDRTYNVVADNGNQIKCGIEFNGRGQRVAYHFFRQHPGDGLTLNRDHRRVRILAPNVMHIYEVIRPGQIRGVPKSIAAIVKLHQLDKYDDAELMRKAIAALFAGFITQPDGEGQMFGGEGAPNADDQSEVTLEPGIMKRLQAGETIEFASPADVGGNYEAFQLRNLLAVSAALGVPYANMSNDFSKVNYSSQRAALLEFQRSLRQSQMDIIAHQFCRNVWEAWIETALLAGVIEGDAHELKNRVTWTPPKWDWVDPLKDVKAEVIKVDNGFIARSKVQAAEGGDPEAVDEQIASDQRRAEGLGLSFGEAGARADAESDAIIAQDEEDERRRQTEMA